MRFPSCRFLSYLLLLCSVAVTASTLSPKRVRRRTCGTSDPSINLTSLHEWLQNNEEKENELWNGTMIRRHVEGDLDLSRRTSSLDDSDHVYDLNKRQVKFALFTVDTYVHIVADSANASPGSSHYVTSTQIANQMSYLNNAFAPVGIAYRLVGITRTTNDTWASNGDDLAMKKTLRQGTFSTLNLYYQTLLQSNDPNVVPMPGAFLLGFCTLPTAGITPSSPSSSYVTDGCNILSGTLPGAWQTGYNQGGTTAHEVGHWNGLLHTFQGYSCDSDDWGDYVADTPQEGDSATGCPRGKDTCPKSGIAAGQYDGIGPNPYGPQGYAGLDPVTNFMDYTTDACYEGFTPGQGARMVNIWVIYRQGR